MIQKILVIAAMCGFANPLSAANFLCSGFEVASPFYYSKAALDDLKPTEWQSKPFMVKNFPGNPVWHRGDEKFPLKKVASSSSPFQGDLYIIQTGLFYYMWEFRKDVLTEKDKIYFYYTTTMTYESECEELVD